MIWNYICTRLICLSYCKNYISKLMYDLIGRRRFLFLNNLIRCFCPILIIPLESYLFCPNPFRNTTWFQFPHQPIYRTTLLLWSLVRYDVKPSVTVNLVPPAELIWQIIFIKVNWTKWTNKTNRNKIPKQHRNTTETLPDYYQKATNI